MLSKALGSIGRFLITSGIVVLLFVAYQLWGTGLQEAAAQDSLDDEFSTLLAEVDAGGPSTTIAPSTTAAETTTTVAATTTAPSTTVPFGPIEMSDEELAEVLYREGGEAIARIDIPAIDVTKIVVEGVTVEDLRSGPGHYRATTLPGQPGNTGIAGHRTTYGAPFNRIDELVPGDEFTVETVQGLHTYRVLPAREAFGPTLGPSAGFVIPAGEGDLGHIIVRPEDTWVLGDFDDNRITLTACHPKRSASRRIIVAAELVSEPVVAPPPPEDYSTADDATLSSENVDDSEATDPDLVDATGEDGADSDSVDGTSGATRSSDSSAGAFDRSAFADEVSLDEGLDGDEGALLPAVLWGFAAIATYTFFKQLARRWMMLPSIALGFVPVLIFTALSFEKIDRFLPAG